VREGLCRLRYAFEVSDCRGLIHVLLTTSEVSGRVICIGAVCLRLQVRNAVLIEPVDVLAAAQLWAWGVRRFASCGERAKLAPGCYLRDYALVLILWSLLSGPSSTLAQFLDKAFDYAVRLPLLRECAERCLSWGSPGCAITLEREQRWRY